MPIAINSDKIVLSSEKNTEELSPAEKKRSIQMMRVNLAGEVAAQALYRGQSLVCKDAEVREHLIEAGDEETDHLVWCKKRLDELEGNSSILNPIWYAGSFAIGAIFGRFGEKVSLGFVEETEKQVVAHIDRHLDKISPKDKETIEILKTMPLFSMYNVVGSFLKIFPEIELIIYVLFIPHHATAIASEISFFFKTLSSNLNIFFTINATCSFDAEPLPTIDCFISLGLNSFETILLCSAASITDDFA